MSLTATPLLDDLADHLKTDVDLSALVIDLYHGRADLEAKCPFVIYQIPRLDYEASFGGQDRPGNTAEAVVILTAIDESSGDTALLTSIAERLDELMRSWAPSIWSVRDVTLTTERLDAFDGGGRTYQSCSLTYSLQMEKA